MDKSTAYDTVLEYSRHVINLEKVDQIMRWDSDVMMPPKGTEARSAQRATLSTAEHRFRTDPRVGKALDILEDTELSEDQMAIVREIRREYGVETSVPPSLHDELSDTSADAHEAWKQARETADFDAFASKLDQLVSLRRKWAAEVSPGGDPFETLWSKQTGYLSNRIPMDVVEMIFDDLREALVPLIRDIQECGITLTRDDVKGRFQDSDQFALNRCVLDVVGVDWNRTRLDRAPHPFSYGTPFDVRMTTRFDESDPLDGLLSTLHEFGHTTYAHGLPAEHYGTPLGEPCDVSIHESQSRFWENHVGRSREFWELFLPKMKTHLDGLEHLTVQDVYEAVNRVNSDNVIRVEADELTYHLHIILRTEIARELIHDNIDVTEVPTIWNRKMDEYLGVVPDTVANGPLQDPHWTNRIPAFPTYTIGSVCAAQFYAAMQEDFDVAGDIAAGEFDRIHEWLTQHVHRHGRRYPATELIERATGEPLTAEYFIEYATQKYSSLYSL